MGCPRDRVNEEWKPRERESWSRCPRVEDKEERSQGIGKQRFEFETITVRFCTAMNQGNQNHARRGVLVQPE